MQLGTKIFLFYFWGERGRSNWKWKGLELKWVIEIFPDIFFYLEMLHRKLGTSRLM